MKIDKLRTKYKILWVVIMGIPLAFLLSTGLGALLAGGISAAVAYGVLWGVIKFLGDDKVYYSEKELKTTNKKRHD